MRLPKIFQNPSVSLALLVPGMLSADVVLHEWTFQSGIDSGDTFIYNSYNGIFSVKPVGKGWDLSDFGGESGIATALQSKTNGNFPRFIIAKTAGTSNRPGRLSRHDVDRTR